MIDFEGRVSEGNMCKFRKLAQDGNAMVEFALVVPILVLLVMGAFDLGWSVYARNSVGLAAREGARRAIIVTATDATICSQAQRGTPGMNFVCNSADADTNRIVISPSPTRTSGVPVSVTATYIYRPITPIISRFFPGGKLTLTSQATMVVE